MPVSGKSLVGAFSAMLCLCTGCVSAWWNAFLDPTQVGNFRETGIIKEIQQTISFSDKPFGIPNAVDPTPEDLVAKVEEYAIGPGDVLEIRMLDFLARDAESTFTVTVDELGFMDVPQLGLIQVEGVTAQDVRTELVQQAQAKGIYSRDIEPTVTVTMMMQQHRQYNISGLIAAPGVYRIPRPDFRLREAINVGGDLDETVKTVYVFRGAERAKRIDESVHRRSETGGLTPGERDESVPPVAPGVVSASAGGPAPAGGEAGGDPMPTARAGSGPAGDEAAAQAAERELMDAVAPGSGVAGPPGSQVRAASAPVTGTSAPSPSLPTFIFEYVNDEWKEASPAGPEMAPTSLPTKEAVRPKAAGPGEPVDWQALASEGQQRIIRIPADRLRNGDTNYDIVVRHQDWIRLDRGPVGLFYVGGHVARPGTYSLTGEEMTLTQAVFAAGGLDMLAWPTRCEIRRRIDHDREEITQWDLARIIEGKDPDLFIKPNDVINVGTHAIAPLLATIRNSFRLTYGFGFVYDRNFADIDAYYGQGNPDARRRAEREARFPGLFP